MILLKLFFNEIKSNKTFLSIVDVKMDFNNFNEIKNAQKIYSCI